MAPDTHASPARSYHGGSDRRGGGVAGEFDDIRQRLEGIAEELADLAIQRLRDSIDAGGTELPVDERRLTRARRAVEKAAAILSDGTPPGWGPQAR